MGILVDLALYRRAKEEAAQQKELDEIASLKQELSVYLEDLGPIEPEMYVAKEDDVEAFHRRMIMMMLHTLDGYSDWPIDSSKYRVI